MARFKAALEQEARKSDQEDQMSSKEACEARTTAILLDSDDFRISKPFDMDKATLLPLRGSLGRKPGRATQAKVRAKEKKKRKKDAKKEELKILQNKKRRRKKQKRIEKKRKTKLARSKTRIGRLGKS